MKTFVENQSSQILGKTYFDCRYNDYFTVKTIDESGNWAELLYEKRGEIRQAVSFIVYHIDMKQYLPKIA
jgi:hypothetical protein